MTLRAGRALAFMLAFLLASSAAAQAEGARELLDRALALREQGQDEEALALFRRAHALEPSAQTLGQIALAEQALGRFREAERDLSEALEMGGPWVEQHRAALGEALETIRGHLGTLELTGGVDGASVRVNGEEVGVLPLPPLSVEAGVAIVEVSAEGFLPYQRQLEIAAREHARREVALVPRPETAVDAAAPAPAAPTPPPAIAAAGPDGGLIVGTILAFTLAAGGIATFAGAGAAAQAEYDGLATGCGATMACTEADVSSLRSSSLAADIGLGVGAAALVAGAVMVGVVVASGSGGETARLEVGPRGVSLRGAF